MNGLYAQACYSFKSWSLVAVFHSEDQRGAPLISSSELLLIIHSFVKNPTLSMWTRWLHSSTKIATAYLWVWKASYIASFKAIVAEYWSASESGDSSTTFLMYSSIVESTDDNQQKSSRLGVKPSILALFLGLDLRKVSMVLTDFHCFLKHLYFHLLHADFSVSWHRIAPTGILPCAMTWIGTTFSNISSVKSTKFKSIPALFLSVSVTQTNQSWDRSLCILLKQGIIPSKVSSELLIFKM